MQAEVLQRPVQQVDHEEHHDRADDGAVAHAHGRADGARDRVPGEVEQGVAQAGERAHEGGLDGDDGILLVLVGALLERGSDTEDEGDRQRVGIEVLQVTLHRVDALLLGSILIELLEHGGEAVGQGERLHALVVVRELAALGPQQDLVEGLFGNLAH